MHFRAFLYIPVHWNARMTEMKRSVIEVILVFADNVPFLQKHNMECSLKCLHFRAFLYIPTLSFPVFKKLRQKLIKIDHILTVHFIPVIVNDNIPLADRILNL